MSGSLKKPQSFGKCDKDAAWSRVMRAQCSLSPSAARIGAAMSMLAGVGFFLALDAKTLAFAEGYQGLWLLPRGMESVLTSIPSAISAALMIILMLISFQTIVRLVSMFRTDEPIIVADYHGLVVRAKTGPAGFNWTDIERVRDLPGMMILRLKPGSHVKTKSDVVWSGSLIWIPTMFLEGGAQGLMNAIAHVRPDLVRHWWPDVTINDGKEDEEELAMVGFGKAAQTEAEMLRLHIRGKSVGEAMPARR